jgi:hypothetical protein
VPGDSPRTSFLPTASLRVFANGNVNVVGDGQSAVGASVDLVLPVAWIRPRSSWSAQYSTGSQVYGRRHDRANNLAHSVSTSYRRTTSRRSSFGLNLAGSRSQQQGHETVRPDQVITLVPRTDVTRVSGGINGSFTIGTRSHVSFGIHGGLNRYGDIPEGDLDAEPVADEPSPRIAFVNSANGGATFGWGMSLSRRTTLGLGYSYHRVGFEDPGPLATESVASRDAVSHSLYFNGARTLGPYTSGSLQIGVLRAQQEGFEARVEPSVGASIVRQVSQESSLSVGLRQSMGAGNGRSGASVDRGVYGSWIWGRPTLSGSVLLGYWQRESLNPVLGRNDSTTALQMSESFGWTPGLRFSYGVFHSFRDQQADDATLEAKGYHSGGLFVRWNIRGRSNRVG